ncbi:MAG TPA: cellulose biosynthesis cyclic di-GMP-binding regulatory protein BcsB [Anaerolineales bacterium]|nr:cellulose biosynthesis cyclic di-GMP-binding regulatory protein BcsB [Anaerolineales bacterium]
MKSRISFFLFVSLVVIGSLLLNLSSPVSAQGTDATPTSQTPLPEGTSIASTPTTSSLEETLSTGANTINFFQIRQEDIQLVGPYDVAFLVFGLPAEWELNAAATLNLSLHVSVSAVSATLGNELVSGAGGTLSVEFNRQVVGSFPLPQNEDLTIPVQIPLELLEPVRDDGHQEIVFVLDSGFSCLINQQMSLTIRSSSNVTFPHAIVLPDTNLARFPFPIYQDTIYPDSALMVIPDQPTAEELQSAMALSAGLGRMSSSSILLDLTTVSKISPEQIASNNIILVGKAASFPLLDQLQLPLAPAAGRFQSEADDGIVQLVHSPWGTGRVVLLVSGNSDAGVVKATQAVSTGILRQNATPNLSVIESVQESIQQLQQNTDFTLMDQGYESAVLQRRGVDSVSYNFYIPPGMTVSPDAYFELVYGNSALIDYARSGLVVQANGQPIGSVRFSDETASNTTNRSQINIPASVVLPGTNTVEIISNLQPTDNCSIPNLRGLWANIWSESRFHLPLIQSVAETNLAIDLADFPAPFVLDPSLRTTAFVLQPNDLESWRSAQQLALYLGDRGNGSIVLLKSFYADAIPESARTDLNLIVIGLAPQMPIMTELNQFLPAPFESEAGIASERNMQVTFRIPADSPVGYVEFMPSPWNAKNYVVVAVGNLRQGANWAASGLYDASLRSRLAGNFAVINDQQVTTTDTRISSSFAENPIATTQSEVVVVPPSVDTTVPVPVSRPIWILPVLMVTVGLIALILIGVVYNSAVQSRRRGKFKPAAEEEKS